MGVGTLTSKLFCISRDEILLLPTKLVIIIVVIIIIPKF